MEYKVVCGQDGLDFKTKIRDLEEQVNALIKQGWKPQGGIFSVNGNTFYQVMVK